MTSNLTEQQQIEQLKHWWRKYGLCGFMIFFIFLLASVAWHFWQKHQEIKFQRGSKHYETLLNAVANDEETVVLKEANLLKNNYTHTPYAALASLMIARSYVYQHHYLLAEKQLQWVVKHAGTDTLKQTARLRLARLYLQEKKPMQALAILEKINCQSYFPLIEEIKGDSYLVLGEIAHARALYQTALNFSPNYAVMRPILMMKIDDLASYSEKSNDSIKQEKNS